MKKEESKPVWQQIKQIIETCGGEDFMKSAGLLPKQETLEEAAENYINKFYTTYAFKELLKNLFIEAAKWQQERMYSEEEVKHLIKQACYHSGVSVFHKFEKWFNKFKKK